MVRSVMAALVLVIFPGFMAGQECALRDPVRASLEEVVHFDYDEVTITAEAEQLTTTSFGKERPLVNRSEEGAWAQNRRVEFVITSVSGPTLAGGDPIIVGGDVPIVVGGDPRALVVAQPERTLVGDVEVDPLPKGEVQPSLVRTHPNLERDRQSRFYRDPFAAPDVRGGRWTPEGRVDRGRDVVGRNRYPRGTYGRNRHCHPPETEDEVGAESST